MPDETAPAIPGPDGALPLLTGPGWRDSADVDAEQAWSDPDGDDA